MIDSQIFLLESQYPMRYAVMPMKGKQWVLIGVTAVAALVFSGLAVAKFVVPGKTDRLRAAGSLNGLNHEMKVAFSDQGEFASFPKPGPQDWMSQHPEKGQTYDQFCRFKPNPLTRQRRVLYIQPLGQFDEANSPSLDILRDFTSAYYYPMKVVVRPMINPRNITSRVNGGQQQWLTKDVLDDLQKRLPADAYSMLGVTMTDLYPDPSWNFVFGQARFRARVGVFSFARFQTIREGMSSKELLSAKKMLLKRAAKILTHETGHMFGVRHCIYYHCNMNGANHQLEADATPMHLCPVCLRKLQHTINFSPRARYQKLHQFYQKHQLGEEADWVKARLERMKDPG